MDADASDHSLRGSVRGWGAAACLMTLLAVAADVCAQTTETAPSAEAPRAADASTLVTEPAAEADTPARPEAEGELAPEWNRPRPPLQGIDAQLHRLATDLRLDAAQQQKIRPILAAQRDEMQRLQRDPQLKSVERHSRILALGDQVAEQIRAQLTDEQRAQYIKPRARRVTTRPAPGARRPAAATTSATPGGKDPR